jgi:hypothetical protein
MGRCSHTFPHLVDSSGLKFSSVCLSDADVKPKKPKLDEDTPAAAVRIVYVCVYVCMHACIMHHACMHVPVLWISQNHLISRGWSTSVGASRNPLVSPQAPTAPKGANADLPPNGELPWRGCDWCCGVSEPLQSRECAHAHPYT